MSTRTKESNFQVLDLQDMMDTKQPKAFARSGLRSEYMKRKAKARKCQGKGKGKGKEAEVIDTESKLVVGLNFKSFCSAQHSASLARMRVIDNFCSIMENPLFNNKPAFGYYLEQIKSSNPERHHFVYCD